MPTHPALRTSYRHPPPPPFSSSYQRLLQSTGNGNDDDSHNRKSRHQYLCFRFPSSRASTFRLLGAAVCACSLFHFIVHLFVSDLFNLLSPHPVHLNRKEYARNLTWHIGPELLEDDRRAILIYSSPYLPTIGADEALSAHPRVVWLHEQLISRYMEAQRAAHRPHSSDNMGAMLTHLFNCSTPALPLLLQVLNEEAVARGETEFCFPRGHHRVTSSNSGNIKCKHSSSSASGHSSCSTSIIGKVKKVKKDAPKCKKVTRRQLRTFCLQHHLAVRLTDPSWRLRQLSTLPTPNLKLVQLIGMPILYRNETSHLHFSSRTHKLSRLYHNVILKPKRKAYCEQLSDDLDWIAQELSSSSGWYYQRFPADCFEGNHAEGCVLEAYNFLDIYVSDRIRKRAQEVGNASRTSGDQSDTSGSFLDLTIQLSEGETYLRLKAIYNQTCGAG